MAAARSVMLTLIGMLIASSIILLPPTETAFRNVSAAVLVTVLVISYAGFVLVPGLAIHGADGFEPQHAGLWRGPFTHKNIAGPVMSIFVMFGIYLWRRDMRITGFVVAILSLIFVLKTGSKTTNGLLPVAVMIVLAGRIVGSPRLTIALYVLAVVATGALTIGTVFSTALSQIDTTLLGDPTFTGRSTLWTYGLQSFPEHFWLGTGYDSFWGTPRVTGLEPSYEWDWDFRGIVHGHSNYVDMLLTTGIVGTAILIAVLYVGPAVNYVRACRNPENRACADLFMMAMVFLTLLSFLETFFLRRVDPIWLLMMVSVTQLQVLARTGSEEPRTGAVPSL
jgi:O-antigen ligase